MREAPLSAFDREGIENLMLYPDLMEHLDLDALQKVLERAGFRLLTEEEDRLNLTQVAFKNAAFVLNGVFMTLRLSGAGPFWNCFSIRSWEGMKASDARGLQYAHEIGFLTLSAKASVLLSTVASTSASDVPVEHQNVFMRMFSNLLGRK